MQAWAQGKLPESLLPSETIWFAKLALAIALHEVDEDVIDRQRPLWLRDLAAMMNAQSSTEAGPSDGINEASARSMLAQLAGKRG